MDCGKAFIHKDLGKGLLIDVELANEPTNFVDIVDVNFDVSLS